MMWGRKPDTRTEKRKIGDAGETTAARYLQGAGYTIAEQNYRTRGGEIDIIAWHHKPLFGKTLCFIEVKTRQYNDGSAERATDKHKLERMFKTARAYCLAQSLPLDQTPMQFEHISVYTMVASPSDAVRHYVIPIE